MNKIYFSYKFSSQLNDTSLKLNFNYNFIEDNLSVS